MLIGPVRVCYLKVFKPGTTPSGALKYSATPLIPNSDTVTVDRVNKAVQEAIEKAIDKGTFPKSAIPRLKLPLRNGSEEHESGKRGAEFNGHMFFNANNDNQPGILGPDKMPVLDEKELYSGCWCYLDITFFGYKNVSVGVGASLNNVMKVKDDTRLDGRQSADEAFKDIPTENIENDLDDGLI